MDQKSDRQFTVGICETQPLVVEGLRRVLAESGMYRLLEPAATLEEAGAQAISLAPRVMVLDKRLGLPCVLEWLAQTRGRAMTATIVWGDTVTEADAVRFLKAGAKGVLRKTAPVDCVLACFDAVVSGRTWMEDSLFRDTLCRERQARSELTVRERQVVELVEQGMRNKEIARELGIRPGTVKIHLKHIFEKTGIRGRYGLALSGLQGRNTAPRCAA